MYEVFFIFYNFWFLLLFLTKNTLRTENFKRLRTTTTIISLKKWQKITLTRWKLTFPFIRVSLRLCLMKRKNKNKNNIKRTNERTE